MDNLPKSSWTYPAVLRMQAEKYGSRNFCSFHDGTSLSFQDYETQSNKLASALADIGVKPGDRVMALLHNSREFVLIAMATFKRGAVFVPTNTELKGAFLRHQLLNAQPTAVVVEAELRAAFDEVDLTGISITATVLVGDGAAALPGTQAYGFEALAKTLERATDLSTPTPYDVCTISFTSGTSGPSKGVLAPHAHCFYNGMMANRKLKVDDTDRMYITMPMFHSTAAWAQFYGSLIAGASVYMAKRFSASNWLSDIRRHGSTITYVAGVMTDFILKRPEEEDDKNNPLRAVWMVPVSDIWAPVFQKRFGVSLIQFFGMTETSICSWGELGDPVKAGYAGRVVEEFFDLAIVDPDTDEMMPPNQIGEIVTRPKEPGVFMAGYNKMPERTVEAWRNLWFHTGDAGYLDEEGRLFYADRIRDRIRRRGENISAFEVEDVINSHPDVIQCAVVGVKVDGAGGEDEVLAYVVSRSASLTPHELLDWCVTRIPRYAVPRFIEFAAQIESTATGKIRKQSLRDAGVTAKTWDRESVGYVVPRQFPAGR